MKSTFRRDAGDRYIREVIPIRYVVREFNRRHPGEAVFFTEEIDVPDALGQGVRESLAPIPSGQPAAARRRRR